MVIVDFDHNILDLLLHADADASREWCLEGAIDIRRKELRRDGGM